MRVAAARTTTTRRSTTRSSPLVPPLVGRRRDDGGRRGGGGSGGAGLVGAACACCASLRRASVRCTVRGGRDAAAHQTSRRSPPRTRPSSSAPSSSSRAPARRRVPGPLAAHQRRSRHAVRRVADAHPRAVADRHPLLLGGRFAHRQDPLWLLPAHPPRSRSTSYSTPTTRAGRRTRGPATNPYCEAGDDPDGLARRLARRRDQGGDARDAPRGAVCHVLPRHVPVVLVDDGRAVDGARVVDVPGKVSSWSALLNTFEESCALGNSMPFSDIFADALDDAGYRLLSRRARAARVGAADAVHDVDWASSPSSRAPSRQRWARVWNELCAAARARPPLQRRARRAALLLAAHARARALLRRGRVPRLPVDALVARLLRQALHRRLQSLYLTRCAALQARDLPLCARVARRRLPEHRNTLCAVTNRLWAHAAAPPRRTADGPRASCSCAPRSSASSSSCSSTARPPPTATARAARRRQDRRHRRHHRHHRPRRRRLRRGGRGAQLRVC